MGVVSMHNEQFLGALAFRTDCQRGFRPTGLRLPRLRRCLSFVHDHDTPLDTGLSHLALLIQLAELLHQRFADGRRRGYALHRPLQGIELVVALCQIVQRGYCVEAVGLYGPTAEGGTLQFTIACDDQTGTAADALAVDGSDVGHQLLDVRTSHPQNSEEILERSNAEDITAAHRTFRHGCTQTSHVADA